jgi:CRISPR-associated protein Cpf1
MFSNNSIFNRYTCDIIKKHGIKVAIGIDRGEKHLAYVTIVDINGKLLEEPISLNKIINSKGFTTDYLKLLSDCEQERLENRQNWDAVRRIKDLKEGYVSHCVKFIVDKMIEHEAIVVLENLNIGFKQGRSKIERNVYNQLENALLSKLQYIVDKTKLADEPFGIKNGVQLTPADIAPGDVRMSGNQMGFVFYVDPSYTSAVDPVTGYRQQMRLNEKIKCSNFATFISSAFNDIKYNKGDVIFTFSWEKLAKTVNNLSKDKYINDDLKKDLISSKVWTITANVDRVVWDKNANGGRGQNKKLNVQKELELLFEEYNIKLDRDLKTQISKANFSSKDVKRFCYLFNLINKIRNSADDRDDIISPVIGGLDSRKDKFQGFEWNGDANGAYNIARKGAILLNRLYNTTEGEKFDKKVSRKDYDTFITDGR